MNAGTAGYLSGRPPTGRPFCELLPAIGSRELRFLRQTSKASRVQACGDLPHKTSEPDLVFASSKLGLSSLGLQPQLHKPADGLWSCGLILLLGCPNVECRKGRWLHTDYYLHALAGRRWPRIFASSVSLREGLNSRTWPRFNARMMPIRANIVGPPDVRDQDQCLATPRHRQ